MVGSTSLHDRQVRARKLPEGRGSLTIPVHAKASEIRKIPLPGALVPVLSSRVPMVTAEFSAGPCQPGEGPERIPIALDAVAGRTRIWYLCEEADQMVGSSLHVPEPPEESASVGGSGDQNWLGFFEGARDGSWL